MHKKAVVHWRSTRLYVNAGMRFPVCYASAKLLDLDKTGLPTSGELSEVTCKRCRRAAQKEEGSR